MFLTLRAISRVPVKSGVCLCHPYILYKCIYKCQRWVLAESGSARRELAAALPRGVILMGHGG
jgi:hypothetical protein